ncbi:hypothetical protein ACOMHN_006918 [Nucella lapillus]
MDTNNNPWEYSALPGNAAVTNLTSRLKDLAHTASAMLSSHLTNGGGERVEIIIHPHPSTHTTLSPSTTDDHHPNNPTPDHHHTLLTISLLSLLFFVIVLVGIIGNALVIFVILTDRKMRQSVTNLLILNLAVADLVMMVLGVPEIVQFVLDRGWVIGIVFCRLDRFLLVVCLYVSVMSLVSVCIESVF